MGPAYRFVGTGKMYSDSDGEKVPAPECAICLQPVERVDTYVNPFTLSVEITLKCHGQSEKLHVDRYALGRMLDEASRGGTFIEIGQAFTGRSLFGDAPKALPEGSEP